jgi:RNA polymerase sigma factor (sigma-70 family)
VPAEVILAALERDAESREADVPLAALAERSGEVPVDVAAAVTTALARLPSDESQLLEAFHFERQRVKALAERMGITERAVEGRLRRARERLRGELLDILPSIEGGVL